MGQTQHLFVYFRPFPNTMTNIAQNLTINGRSIDGVLGIRTRNHRIVGADESTELWLPQLLEALAIVDNTQKSWEREREREREREGTDKLVNPFANCHLRTEEQHPQPTTAAAAAD